MSVTCVHAKKILNEQEVDPRIVGGKDAPEGSGKNISFRYSKRRLK